MNIKAPTLAPLFRSDAQGEILARLFLNPDRAFTISELARAASTPYASAHREVSRIAEMGLATTEKRGHAVEVQARRDTPVFRPLAELLGLTYGPAVVIPNHLAGIAGITEAYIYGSWAARRQGEPGDTPGDIDLLIVGDPPRGEVYEAARVAGSALAREVNPRIVSAAAWDAGNTDPFLRTLTKRPLIQQGRLTRVAANRDLAESHLTLADTHLIAAATLRELDRPSARRRSRSSTSAARRGPA